VLTMSEVCFSVKQIKYRPQHPTSPWPFMQWGLDVVGPLPQAQPQLRFLLVATDYFTKWVEAVSLSEVTG